MNIFTLLIGFFTTLLVKTMPAEAIKCHPYVRVCIEKCKKAHEGSYILRNMCIGGCKFTQCALKPKDSKLSI
ncbi:hypothetical protein TpMuguga_04g00584 [Theileria parva strain Muguga]|uniref:Uncharacterized protein n=1 Tax=Theileria parva TaxID=5875 RepID=Q4N1Z3_THEPA|nr:uncharacterized protein TpMuguga_04g00584 [Theileria parva strain Muguga]EAN31936.1 hypothetical protein TpMuguga_04g00584 [Theileria parva strain Muguga]|eukprot:XP_764219.1 hypothetical protein [Theileria parva strain Muguga]